MAFTKKHSTFDEWHKAQKNPDSAYVKRVAKAHEKYPNLPLNALRGHGKANDKQMLMVVGATVKAVTPKNERNRVLIGQYWTALKAQSYGDKPDALNKFQKKFWMDSEGNKHRFVTDDDVLYQLHKQNKLQMANSIYLTK